MQALKQSPHIRSHDLSSRLFGFWCSRSSVLLVLALLVLTLLVLALLGLALLVLALLVLALLVLALLGPDISVMSGYQGSNYTAFSEKLGSP